METRRLGRTEHRATVLVHGGAALSQTTQDVADASIQEALDAGITQFDVAASYGAAEERLGPWMADLRGRIFLSTKVEERGYDAAWASINRSLERLRVDSVDLLQLHAVGDLAELDRAMGRGGDGPSTGGALAAVLRAHDEGMTRFVGITGHGDDAPTTHLEALRRHPFDTVLTPVNYRLFQDPLYRAGYEALVAEVARQDAGLMTIKTVSRRNWPEGATPTATTWYEPFEDQERISAAVAWVLARPEVTAIPTPGDVRLLGAVVRAERERASMTVADAEAVLERAPDYTSPFVAMPW